MKKTPIIVTLVVIAFMGLGFLLYKISPKPVPSVSLKEFDLSQVKKIDQPRAIEASDHILGKSDAKNTVVAYEDIQCPACRAFKPILNQIPSALTDTKVVFRHYPLYPSPHPNSLVAAYATEAANAQGKFWEFTDLMYDRQEEWAELKNPIDKIAEIAQAAGVSNIEQFKSDILDSKNFEKIQADSLEAVGLGVNATPTLLFNGHKLTFKQGTIDEVKQLAEPFYIK